MSDIDVARKQTLQNLYWYLVNKRLLCERCGTVVMELSEYSKLKDGNWEYFLPKAPEPPKQTEIITTEENAK